MKRVLIIEDDTAIARIERDYLEASNLSTQIESNGEDGLMTALEGDFDIVLLDVMLPGMDGFEVCRRLRSKKDIPILLVTARTDDLDKIRGLGLGADDYIEKPFSPSVLVARVNANIAQYERLKDKECDAPEDELVIGSLKLNKKSRQVWVDDKEVELKNKEYELLHFLMKNAGVVFDRETIYEHVWGMDALGDNATVAVHINRLREKIETDSANPQYIQTVRGAGYRMRKKNN
ncbi:MAG: response regulator transcription factor [Eubacteriales bacterium]|nr:response regulator transcription factor [Eubacteriales bacterium]